MSRKSITIEIILHFTDLKVGGIISHAYLCSFMGEAITPKVSAKTLGQVRLKLL
jgi:hypothetical protein